MLLLENLKMLLLLNFDILHLLLRKMKGMKFLFVLELNLHLVFQSLLNLLLI